MTRNTVAQRDGVQVEKHLEEDEYDLPSVVYEFTSERTEPVGVEVVESVSQSLERHQLGFHTEYRPDQYETSGTELVLNVNLEPEAERTIVYAVRTSAPVETEALAMSPPEFSVTSVKATVVREAAASTPSASESAPATQDASATEQTAPSLDDGTADPVQDTEPEHSATAAAGAGDEGPSTTPAETASPDAQPEREPLVDQLVAELQAGAGSEASRDYLAQRFGSTTDASGSLDARISQLQREFADLRAYTSALEEFLDEHGSAQDLIDSYDDRLDAVETDVGSLDASVSQHEHEVTELRETLQTVQSDVDAASAELASLTEDVEDVSAALEQLDERLPDDDVDERLTTIEAELTRLSKFTSKLQDAFQESFTG